MNRRWVAVRITKFQLATMLLASIAVIEPAKGSAPPLPSESVYMAKDTLSESILASRQRFRQWQGRQKDALSVVRMAPWHSSIAAAEQTQWSVDSANVDLAAKDPAGQPIWTSHSDWVDGRVIQPAGPAAPKGCVYLVRKIHAMRPCALTAGIAGVRLDWWLRGKKGSTINAPTGSARPSDIQPAMIDLDLLAGENCLVVRIARPDGPGTAPVTFWFLSDCRSNVAARVWNGLRKDFPTTEFPFFEAVHHQWLDGEGWLGAEPAKAQTLEQTEAVRLLETCIAPSACLQEERRQLGSDRAAGDSLRWLRLCVAAAAVADWGKQLHALDLAIEDLGSTFADRYAGAEFARRASTMRAKIAGFGLGSWDRHDPLRQQLAQQFESLRYDALVAGNPLVSPGRILFVKRRTYTPGWYYAEFMSAAHLFNAKQGTAAGGLHVLSLPDGRVTEVVPQLRGGVFDRYDLSPDGQRVVFGYKSAPQKAFRLYEANIDGTSLRQLTFDPSDEAQRVALYRQNGAGYWHLSDDFHPCYLPDGGIAFASARCQRGVLCDQSGRLAVNVLHRMDGDGRNLRRLSEGALSESTPAVMNDGRILYTRWEYVDKGVIAVQALWTMRPDGSCSQEIYGNDIADPMVLIHGRAIPGMNNLFVCTATFHHPFAVGPIVLVDVNRPVQTLEPLRSLTPDTAASPSILKEQTGQWGEVFAHRRNEQWVPDNRGPLFSEPYPLSEPTTGKGAGKYFLVDCNPSEPWGHGSAYGLYLIDVFGNRVRIYGDPQISCWQPIPLRARPAAPVLPSQNDSASGSETEPAGTLVLADVYRGLHGVPRGTVRYLRVLEQVAQPWSARRFWPDDTALGQHAPIGKNSHIHVKVHHGVVPVHQDGSAHFTVPARRNIFLQALDENFMEVQRMRTFINLQPGERRSCVGCHEGRTAAPPLAAAPRALEFPPARPGPQPGEQVPRPIHYVTDVQPIWDRHCVSCHGNKRRDAGLDLTGTPTQFFNRSYENIMDRNLIACIGEFIGPRSDQFSHVVPLPPQSLGSHASRLLTILSKGHGDVKMTREEMIRIVTWADANAPFYGTYFGRRNLSYSERTDFRPVPTLESALGVAPPKTP